LKASPTFLLTLVGYFENSQPNE